VARAFVNRPKNGQLPCRVLITFNKSCAIPRVFAIATVFYGTLATDSECKPTQLQDSSRQLTTNLSHQGYARQTPQAQASSSGSQRAEKPSGRLEGILQRADSAQQTSDSGER